MPAEHLCASHEGSVIELSVMKLLGILALLLGMFLLIPCPYSEAGALSAGDGDIERADRLGEEFQRLGPWSRPEPGEGLFYGIPQAEDYLATPEGQLPRDDSGSAASQYPLCYNPYTGSYEYCYPGESSYFRLRFRSPEFRSWWRRGRACPPGHYFMPEKGCYRR